MDNERLVRRLAAYITTMDIDEDICKNKLCMYETAGFLDCVDCVVEHFSKECKWEQDEVCVNDASKHCADFVSDEKCGSCNVREVKRFFKK